MIENIEYTNITKLEGDILAHILDLEGNIFPEPLSRDKIARELSTKKLLSRWLR